MLIFLEYTHIEEIYYYIQAQQDLPVDVFFHPSRYVNTLQPSRWQDIETYSQQSIFALEDSTKILLVDISNLYITSYVSELVNSLSGGEDIYFYNSGNHKLASGDKKILKQGGFCCIQIKKIPRDIQQEIVSQYISNRSITIPPNNLNSVMEISTTMREALDILDILDASPQYLTLLQEKPIIPLYLQSFNPTNKKNILVWYNNTQEAELQLALSLILTKLKKQPNSTQLIQTLIQTDNLIKTTPKISPMTWYKLFLWRVINHTQSYEI